MPPRLGAHMSIAGGLDKAVERAVFAGCEALQVFVKSSNQWKGRALGDDEALRFRDGVTRAHLQPVMAHASYLINCASPDDALWEKSIHALGDELNRCVTLRIPYLVMHPGSHMGAGEIAGCERIARALDIAIQPFTKHDVTLLLENTAGQGTNLGYRFEQLAEILRQLAVPSRFGVCIDTAHTFAAGYDISTEVGWEETWRELDRIVGWERVKALHVNDSKRPCGSRLDRHEHIGLGLIGIAAFSRLINDTRFDGLPASLETEKTDEGCEDQGNLAILRALFERKTLPTAARVAQIRERAIKEAQELREA